MCDWQVKDDENERMRKFYGFDLAQTARKDFSVVSVTHRSALQQKKVKQNLVSQGPWREPQSSPKEAPMGQTFEKNDFQKGGLIEKVFQLFLVHSEVLYEIKKISTKIRVPKGP